MMEIPPSRLGSLPLVRYLRTSLVIGALSLVAGCVSQSEVLTVDTSVRQPAPQLGLTNEAQSGVIVASGEAEVLPPNVPLRAPRVANLQAPTAQTQPVPSSTSVLAAVQPEAKQAAPAQTAIDQAASTTNVGTTEVSVTAATATSDIAATAPSNTSTAGLSTSSTTILLTNSFLLQLLIWNLRTKLDLNTTVIQSPHSVLFSLRLTIESL